MNEAAMQAMVLARPGELLRSESRPLPEPRPGQIRLRVLTCGVCRTDLHVCDGELAFPDHPVVPGHEVVGVVDALGAGVTGLAPGQRVGVPWLGWTCGECELCRAGHENLCPQARFTGYTLDGGYATHMLADARYCFALPDTHDDLHVAPLLCAGLIGHRALRLAGPARRLGIYGFGAAGHIVCQVAAGEGREVYAFTRPGDAQGQMFARELGACWAGGSDELPPVSLDAALLFAPVGELVPASLRALAPAGVVVCAGIHMSRIPAFEYALLWQERMVRSVANLTRADGESFFGVLEHTPVHTEVQEYPLARANDALDDLRAGRLQGAGVLRVSGS